MSESSAEKKGSFLSQAWLVLLLSLSFGGALAAIEIGLKPIIEENKRAEIFSQIPLLVPGASSEASGTAAPGVYEGRSESGERVGWLLRASGQGFADRIECLIGLDAKGETLTGIYVLDQKETPGLGDYITDRDKFRKWFEGQPTATPLRVVKQASPAPAGEVQALTGATISSDAVAGIVNKRVAEFRKVLAEGGPVQPGAAEQPGQAKQPEQKEQQR
jgi:electron transport complex protein RnfG